MARLGGLLVTGQSTAGTAGTDAAAEATGALGKAQLHVTRLLQQVAATAEAATVPPASPDCAVIDGSASGQSGDVDGPGGAMERAMRALWVCLDVMLEQ